MARADQKEERDLVHCNSMRVSILVFHKENDANLKCDSIVHKKHGKISCNIHRIVVQYVTWARGLATLSTYFLFF